MGNGAQKIGAKLLVLCKDGGFFLFSGVAQIIQRQGAFTENGKQNAGCKCIRLVFLIYRNPNNAVDLLPCTNCEIQLLCLRKCFGRCSGPLAVLPHPVDHILFFSAGNAVCSGSVCRINDPIKQRMGMGRVNQNIPLHQSLYLCCGHLINFLRRFRLLKLLVHIKKELRAIGISGRQPGMCFELCGKCAGQKRCRQHDGKGDVVFATIGRQRQAGFGQEIVEQQDTQKSRQHATGVSAGKSRGQKHTQQVNHNDIGACKSMP